MYSMLIIGVLLLFGVIGLIAYLVGTYNTFVRLVQRQMHHCSW